MVDSDTVKDVVALMAVPLTDDNVAQMQVLLDAYEIFLERDPKYNSVWKEAQPVENAGLAAHKARRAHSLLLSEAPGDQTYEEARDGINYFAFCARQAMGLSA